MWSKSEHFSVLTLLYFVVFHTADHYLLLETSLPRPPHSFCFSFVFTATHRYLCGPSTPLLHHSATYLLPSHPPTHLPKHRQLVIPAPPRPPSPPQPPGFDGDCWTSSCSRVPGPRPLPRPPLWTWLEAAGRRACVCVCGRGVEIRLPYSVPAAAGSKETLPPGR